MGQTASAELAELTECVIDPPQNVSKESEQKEAEMLPERGALRLNETSEMPSKGEEERFLKGLAESMEKIKKTVGKRQARSPGSPSAPCPSVSGLPRSCDRVLAGQG